MARVFLQTGQSAYTVYQTHTPPEDCPEINFSGFVLFRLMRRELVVPRSHPNAGRFSLDDSGSPCPAGLLPSPISYRLDVRPLRAQHALGRPVRRFRRGERYASSTGRRRLAGCSASLMKGSRKANETGCSHCRTDCSRAFWSFIKPRPSALSNPLRLLNPRRASAGSVLTAACASWRASWISSRSETSAQSPSRSVSLLRIRSLKERNAISLSP